MKRALRPNLTAEIPSFGELLMAFKEDPIEITI